MSKATIELSEMSSHSNNIEISTTYGTTTAENNNQSSGITPPSSPKSPYQLQESPVAARGGENHENENNNNNDDEQFVDEDDISSDGEEEEENEMSLTELLYSFHSYHAIVKPVTVTMVLAALSVIFINSDSSRRQSEAMMAETYNVWSIDESDTNAQKLGLSLANTFIMVSVICAMTFLIVVLYKYKCMTFLIGYMIFSSATLLGLLGAIVFETAIELYRLPIDKVTFYLICFNFCIVGVLAIFWSKGIPMYITQGYLVATSVILAWQLSHFDEFTTWALLFMLALYDLCAVLTPCGPLNALVQLMSKDDSPDMPGLLYEAHLPSHARRPGRSEFPSPTTESAGNDNTNSTSRQRPEEEEQQERAEHDNEATSSPTTTEPPPPEVIESTDSQTVTSENASHYSGSRHSESSSRASSSNREDGPTTILPLAIARVYRLPVISYASQPNAMSSTSRRRTNDGNTGNNNGVSTSPLLDSPETLTSSPDFVMPENSTPRQLRSNVVVRLPLNGGRIEPLRERRGKYYLEIDRRGNPKRTIHVDRQGKVFAESLDDEDGEDQGKHANSIRLGLGDFVFYSVLVARAAMYSFTTFIACLLVILAGLGGTLVLLSVFHHALPALPISIILAIIFYLLTRAIIEPWIEDVLRNPYYV